MHGRLQTPDWIQPFTVNAPIILTVRLCAQCNRWPFKRTEWSEGNKHPKEWTPYHHVTFLNLYTCRWFKMLRQLHHGKHLQSELQVTGDGQRSGCWWRSQQRLLWLTSSWACRSSTTSNSTALFVSVSIFYYVQLYSFISKCLNLLLRPTLQLYS